MLSFKPAFSPSPRGSLVPPHFLPLEWYYLHIWGCWYYSQKSLFQFVSLPPQHSVWCSLHVSEISKGTIYSLRYSFPDFESLHRSMSGSNCCFLTCIQVLQETDKVVWYSHLLKNFPQFVVIHTVKGFSTVNGAEVDSCLEFPCFFCDPTDVGNLISGSSSFSKSSLYIWKFSVHVLLKLILKDFEHYLASM